MQCEDAWDNSEATEAPHTPCNSATDKTAVILFLLSTKHVSSKQGIQGCGDRLASLWRGLIPQSVRSCQAKSTGFIVWPLALIARTTYPVDQSEGVKGKPSWVL